MEEFENESINISKNIIEIPIFDKIKLDKKRIILDKFPQLDKDESLRFLSLIKYIENRPYVFFSKGAMEKYLNVLRSIENEFSDKFSNYVNKQYFEINNAFRHLNEISAFSWHDHSFESQEDYQKLLFIEEKLHPAYLRLTEAVFKPLLRIPAYFSRIKRGKSAEALELYDIAIELKGSKLNDIILSYEHQLRNSIAHGSVTYFSNSIIYEDKKKKEKRKKLEATDIINKFDDLLDVCNALILAYSIFILTSGNKKIKIPQNLLIEELKEETRTPYWEVVGCLPSTQVNGSQLITYVQINTLDFRKVNLSVFQTAILAEQLASGYDRYFFSLNSSNSLPGFSAFDGEKLRSHREAEHSIEKYEDVLKDRDLFFFPRFQLPRIVHIAETILLSIRAYRKIKSKHGPEVIVRSTGSHRKFWGLCLEARIILKDPDEEIREDYVKNTRKKIIKEAIKAARKNISYFSIRRYLPICFARIFVYRKDYRVRQLTGLGSDLICTLQISRMGRIQAPDIAGSKVEILGRHRLAWNRQWIRKHSS